MNQRKLIRFGKSAYCVTLPQTWIKRNKLQKGDNLGVLETSRNSLEITHTRSLKEASPSLTIDINGKTLDEITHLLLATYLNGYTMIVLQGKNAGKVAHIRRHVHDFIAAEIMEVTAQTITIHVFWDIQTLDLHLIMNRIGHIIRNICGEVSGMLEGKIDIQDIRERGEEAQRQVLLAKRAITYALNNSSAAQKFNMSSLELFYVSYVIYFLGKIAEHLVAVASVLHETTATQRLTPATKKLLSELLQRALEYLTQVLETYNKRSQQSRFLLGEYQKFEEAIDAFSSPNKKGPTPLWIPLVAEYLRMIIAKIKETEFVMINIENSPK